MKKQSRFKNTRDVGIMSAVGAVLIAPFIGGFSIMAMLCLFAVSFAPMGAAATGLGAFLQKEIWVTEVCGNLFKDNAFLNYSVDHSQYVLAGKVVHIPQAGVASSVVRNRQKYPATVTLRGDSDITYALDEFTTDPRKIENADKIELSYDKMASAVSEDKQALTECIANWFIYHWRPTDANVLRTTGEAVAAHLTNATGNRKRLTLADFKAAKKAMGKQGFGDAGRYVLLDHDMFEQLCEDLKATTTRDYSYIYDAKEGTLPRLEGFTIILRSTVLAATNASTPVFLTPEQDTAAASNAVALFWHDKSVTKALGDATMFETLNSAENYGDLFSFLQRAGGRKRYEDGRGVIGVVQAATA